MADKYINWNTPVAAGDPTVGSMAASVRSGKIKLDGRGGSISAVWTGTPTGTLTVWGCNLPDETDKADISAEFSLITQPAGSGGSSLLDCSDISLAYVWFEYARTSGTGTIRGGYTTRDFLTR